MQKDENDDLNSNAGKCRSECIQTSGHHPDICWPERKRELMTTHTSKRGLGNLIISALTGLPLGGGLGSPDRKMYHIKHIGTARVLLQRLENKHLIPLLYFASKCFLAKDLAKQPCMGGVVALCGCPRFWFDEGCLTVA